MSINASDPNYIVIELCNVNKKPITIILTGGDKKVRKAVYTVTANFNDSTQIVSDIYTYKSIKHGVINYETSQAKEGVNSNYYLRGHEFSSQMNYFLFGKDFKESLDDAIRTDQIIDTCLVAS